MPARDIPFTIETRTVTIQAAGSASPASCADVGAECCSETPDPTGGASGSSCCPAADLAASVTADVAGALGPAGETGTLTLDIERDGDGVTYTGEATGTGVTLSLDIWCVKGDDFTVSWYAAFALVFADSTYTATNLQLTEDGTDLTLEYERAGHPDDPITITVERPCAAPASTWNCVAGTCTEVMDDTGAYATEADCLAACAVPPGGADCASATTIADGLVLTGDPTLGTMQWYKLSGAAGTWHLTITANVGNTFSIYDVCGGGALVGGANNVGCFEFTTSTGDVFLLIDSTSTGAFEVAVSSGACPP